MTRYIPLLFIFLFNKNPLLTAFTTNIRGKMDAAGTTETFYGSLMSLPLPLSFFFLFSSPFRSPIYSSVTVERVVSTANSWEERISRSTNRRVNRRNKKKLDGWRNRMGGRYREVEWVSEMLWTFVVFGERSLFALVPQLGTSSMEGGIEPLWKELF